MLWPLTRAQRRTPQALLSLAVPIYAKVSDILKTYSVLSLRGGSSSLTAGRIVHATHGNQRSIHQYPNQSKNKRYLKTCNNQLNLKV